MAKPLRAVMAQEPETYHGITVFSMRVDDPIPTPRAPQWYAMRVYPDLARYLLTFNHPRNRNPRRRLIERYAADMRADRWQLTPQPLSFDTTGLLNDGQNRLHSVCEFGGDVWMLVTFGWPEDIIYAIDQGAARTSSNALVMAGIPNASKLSGAANKVHLYEMTVGQPRSWVGLPLLSAMATKEMVEDDLELWSEASAVAGRVYHATDKGWGTAVWTAGFIVIATYAGPDAARSFFEELIEGTGEPRSATRELAAWAMRRPVGLTRTEDRREPMEIIVRAYNAWRDGKTLTKPTMKGFRLSRVKS